MSLDIRKLNRNLKKVQLVKREVNEPSKEVVESIANAGEEAALGKSGSAPQERQKQKSTSHPAQNMKYEIKNVEYKI